MYLSCQWKYLYRRLDQIEYEALGQHRQVYSFRLQIEILVPVTTLIDKIILCLWRRQTSPSLRICVLIGTFIRGHTVLYDSIVHFGFDDSIDSSNLDLRLCSRFEALSSALLELFPKESIDLSQNMAPIDLQGKYGKMLNKSSVRFSCEVFQTVLGRYLRVVKFYGGDYDVLNVMLLPQALPSGQTNSLL